MHTKTTLLIQLLRSVDANFQELKSATSNSNNSPDRTRAYETLRLDVRATIIQVSITIEHDTFPSDAEFAELTTYVSDMKTLTESCLLDTNWWNLLLRVFRTRIPQYEPIDISRTVSGMELGTESQRQELIAKLKDTIELLSIHHTAVNYN